MSSAAILPNNEDIRLKKLIHYDILDSESEAMFDDLTKLAASILEVPICLISLVDEHRQWFKSKQGLDADETPRDISFCQHAILSPELFEINNALNDPRFVDSPLVQQGPNIRFYAGAPLTDEEGDSIGTLCAIDSVPREITDNQREALTMISRTVMHLIKLRREKIEAEKLALVKDEFLSNMSHEIRTPLNAIIGFNDLLRKTQLTKEQAEYLETIHLSSQNLKVIINDVLDVSKLENGKIVLEKNPISIQNLLQHVVKLQAPLAKEKGIKLLTSIDHEIPEYVMGDETRLTQIFINLMGNAIKFTPEGCVEIRATTKVVENERAELVFEVKDTGIGIDADKLDSIFERFSQAESNTTRLFGGTGLGLSIVNMLVNLHEGEISVSSEKERGTTFTLNISFNVTERADGLIVPVNQDVNENLFADAYILLVEDNVHNQVLAKNYFQRWGGDIVIAENGAVGVDYASKNSYDIIIMDLQMPIMDGFTATLKIRNELKLDTPIIGCSAHSLVGEKEKCIEVGMNDYVAKPFTEEELIQTTAKYYKKRVTVKESNKTTESEEISDDFKAIITTFKMKQGQEFFDELKKHFVDRVPNDIKQIHDSIQSDDLKVLNEKAHLLSGSLGVMGFNNGLKLSSEVEKLANDGKLSDAKRRAVQLVDYLHRCLVEFNNN